MGKLEVIAAAECQHESYKKHGKHRDGRQRFRCKDCGKSWLEETVRPIGDMRIGVDRATMVLQLLLEGMSVSSVERVTSVHHNTICDLILVVGGNCDRLHRRMVKDVPVTDIQADELWSFCAMKDRTRKQRGLAPGKVGNQWTFIAIERELKLLLAYEYSYHRTDDVAQRFLNKLKHAVTGRFQMSTDGLAAYRWNIPVTFRDDVDFAQLIKQYAAAQVTTRYSPAQIIRTEKVARWGKPVPERVCTSHIETFNQKMRMSLRRFTRLTNAHSKSVDHHKAMQSVMFAHYNFCKTHTTIKATPAVQAGIAAKKWSIGELLTEAAMS